MKRAALFLILLAFGVAFAATPVQVNSGTGTGTSFTASYTSATTAGNTLVLIVSAATATAPTITESLSETVANPVAWGGASATSTYQGGYYVLNTAGGAVTFNVSLSASVAYIWIVAEYSKADATSFDQASAIATTSLSGGSGTLATASLTPAVSGELAIVASVNWHNSDVLTWNNSFVEETNQNAPSSTPPSAAIADQVLSSASAIAGSATASASNGWSMSEMLFRPASGGSCTHAGFTAAGAIATPNGTSGSYRGMAGNFVTPNCSSVDYRQTNGAPGVN